MSLTLTSIFLWVMFEKKKRERKVRKHNVSFSKGSSQKRTWGLRSSVLRHFCSSHWSSQKSGNIINVRSEEPELGKNLGARSLSLVQVGSWTSVMTKYRARYVIYFSLSGDTPQVKRKWLRALGGYSKVCPQQSRKSTPQKEKKKSLVTTNKHHPARLQHRHKHCSRKERSGFFDLIQEAWQLWFANSVLTFSRLSQK